MCPYACGKALKNIHSVSAHVAGKCPNIKDGETKLLGFYAKRKVWLVPGVIK